MNLRVSWKAGNFLTTRVTISFVRFATQSYLVVASLAKHKSSHTPCSRSLLERMWLVKNSSPFIWKSKFYYCVQKSHHWTLSWARWIQCTLYGFISNLRLRFVSQAVYLLQVIYLNFCKTGNKVHVVRFDVFDAAKIKVDVFWVATPCSVAVEYHRFGGRCCVHLQGELHGAEKWTWLLEHREML